MFRLQPPCALSHACLCATHTRSRCVQHAHHLACKVCQLGCHGPWPSDWLASGVLKGLGGTQGGGRASSTCCCCAEPCGDLKSRRLLSRACPHACMLSKPFLHPFSPPAAQTIPWRSNSDCCLLPRPASWLIDRSSEPGCGSSSTHKNDPRSFEELGGLGWAALGHPEHN
jgi:hypothetical protein